MVVRECDTPLCCGRYRNQIGEGLGGCVRFQELNLKIQFTDLRDERHVGDGANGDAGETNEVRSEIVRLKGEGWKERFVMLACDLWKKFILWFLAEISVRNTGCHCLCLALICGVTVKHQTQTYFIYFLHLDLCLWAILFVFSLRFATGVTNSALQRRKL